MDILLVDDEELSRIAIKDFITEQLGHNVFDYTNGVEAFKAWQERHFPVVMRHKNASYGWAQAIRIN